MFCLGYLAWSRSRDRSSLDDDERDVPNVETSKHPQPGSEVSNSRSIYLLRTNDGNITQLEMQVAENIFRLLLYFHFPASFP